MAAFFLPPLLVLAPAKPNLAVTVLLTSKGAARWKWIGLSGAILALTMLAWPTWPGDWLANLHDGGERYSGVPVLLLFGLPVLVFIRNPRLPEARTFIAGPRASDPLLLRPASSLAYNPILALLRFPGRFELARTLAGRLPPIPHGRALGAAPALPASLPVAAHSQERGAKVPDAAC
jgi:hypothetical protein